MTASDSQWNRQLAERLKSVFESARRFRHQRSRPLVRIVHPGAIPRERQLEFELT